MKIESPFGALELHFHRNDSCTLISYTNTGSADAMCVNGMPVTLRKSFAILDGQWQMVESGNGGKPYKNSFINLRYHDWQRNGTPSGNACDKVAKWIEAFLIPDLNRGTYTTEQHAAERRFVQARIDECNQKIAEAKQVIEDCKVKIEEHTLRLNSLPE